MCIPRALGARPRRFRFGVQPRDFLAFRLQLRPMRRNSLRA